MSKKTAIYYTNVTFKSPPLEHLSVDFKSPRSNPPLLEGPLDLLGSPRSNPPPLGGSLGLARRSKVQHPPCCKLADLRYTLLVCPFESNALAVVLPVCSLDSNGRT